MKLRKNGKKYTDDVFDKHAINVEVKLENDIVHLSDEDEAIQVDIKDYSDDDIYNVLKRKGVGYKADKNVINDPTLSLNCMKCDYTTNKAKRLMKHIQTEHQNYAKQPKPSKIKTSKIKKEVELKFKEEYPRSKSSYSRNKILNYLHDEDPLGDDFKDDIIYDINNNIETKIKLEDDLQETYEIEQIVRRSLEEEEVYEDEMFNCADCEFTTKKTKKLRRHIERVHTVRNDPEVEEESEKVEKYRNGKPKNEEWRKYMVDNSTEDDVIRLNCTECTYTANKERNMRRHIQRVHMGNRDYERGTKKTDALMGESESKDGVLLNCTECEYTSTWKKNIRRHIERVHLGIKSPEKVEEPKQCPECSYIGKTKRYLQKHTANMHLPKPKDEDLEELSCDQCVYTTRKRKYLRRHFLENHTERGVRNCEYEDCKYSTKRNERLKRHVQEVHEGIKRDQSNRKKYPLVYKYLCDSCDFKAPAPSALNMHQKRKHLNIKDQVCDQCDYKTASVSSLRQHINFTHLKIKDHECPKCGLKMTTAIKVRQHIKAVHDRIKDQLCPHCGVGFSARSNMIDHVRRVHPELNDIIQLNEPSSNYQPDINDINEYQQML